MPTNLNWNVLIFLDHGISVESLKLMNSVHLNTFDNFLRSILILSTSSQGKKNCDLKMATILFLNY